MYLEKPVGEWPALQVTWSEEPDGRYWAFDGHEAEKEQGVSGLTPASMTT
ncbi:hypothetical protein ENT52713_03200 [Enterobacter sp. 200527-13]|nr:hypothetical protein ENT52713_03200 [Enterobacter sp. 200527-13]